MARNSAVQVDKVRLLGKVLIEGTIEAMTGLHIGGAATGLEIGGIDSVVVRNPMNNQPYIPGSSLKGKMRSLLEKAYGLNQNKEIRKEEPKVRHHECENLEEYKKCPVCPIFGVASEQGFGMPTRLMVRDSFLLLDKLDVENLTYKDGKTELPYTESKWEAVIDRITSAAVPRQIERVPAGAQFKFEMVYDLYNNDEDVARLGKVLESLLYLQNDYLGGMGTRGSGQVKFYGITLTFRPHEFYSDLKSEEPLGTYESVQKAREKLRVILEKIKSRLKTETE